jgi:ADP-ribosylglycohydrolase
VETLRSWAEAIMQSPAKARWPGPTTLRSALHLGDRQQPTTSSVSVGACYRLPALAACLSNRHELARAVREEVLLTHRSEESVAAGLVLAFILTRCLHGISLQEAMPEALAEAEGLSAPSTVVVERCRWVLSCSGPVAPRLDDLREQLGTGAVAAESLPLALAIAARHHDNFTKAVVESANSFRPDQVEPKTPCSSLAEEIQEVNGGNTDGIAALAGCVMGACVGLEGIERKWREVEGYEAMLELGVQFSRQFGWTGTP